MLDNLTFYRNGKDLRKRINFYSQEAQHFALLLTLEANIFKTPNKLFRERINSRTSIRNRCVLTGRSRGIYSNLKLSRISFRKLVLFGSIPGIRKACW